MLLSILRLSWHLQGPFTCAQWPSVKATCMLLSSVAATSVELKCSRVSKLKAWIKRPRCYFKHIQKAVQSTGQACVMVTCNSQNHSSVFFSVRTLQMSPVGAGCPILPSSDRHALSIDTARWTARVMCMQAQEGGWDEGAAVRLQSVPTRLASITTKGPWHLSCAAMSPDGRWVACCNTQYLQLYQLSYTPSGKPSSGVRPTARSTLGRFLGSSPCEWHALLCCDSAAP